MDTRSLGIVFQDGETIVRQGDSGDCMYVILNGQAEMVSEVGGCETRVAVYGAGDFFGETAIFEHEMRETTARAIGQVRLLAVDKDNLLDRIRRDPSLAFRMLETLSKRIRLMKTLDTEVLEGTD